MKNNEASFEKLGLILNKSEEGIFLVVASPRMQKIIAAMAADTKHVVFDCFRLPEEDRHYLFSTIRSVCLLSPDAASYLFFNMQEALKTGEDLIQLNLSRDMLTRLHKNIVFFVTKKVYQDIIRKAYDISSFIKLRVFFEDDEDVKGERADLYDSAGRMDVTLRPIPFRGINYGVDYDIDDDWPREKLLSKAISIANDIEEYIEEYRFRDAEAAGQIVLKIRQRLLGEDDEDTAAAYFALGRVYEKTGEYEKALEYLGKALRIDEKVLGEEHPATASTYNCLGIVCSKQGEYEKALECLGKALRIGEGALGEEHPAVASTCNCLGIVYSKQDEYKKAQEYLGKALRIRERVLGEEHPDTASTYNCLGIVYSKQGEYEKALECLGKALDIRERLFGEEHLATAGTYNNLGVVCKEQGDNENVLEYFGKALWVYEKVLGEELYGAFPGRSQYEKPEKNNRDFEVVINVPQLSFGGRLTVWGRESDAEESDQGILSGWGRGSRRTIDMRNEEGIIKESVIFGRYPFGITDMLGDKAGGKPLLWRMLRREYDRVLLITENLIDCRKYNDTLNGITWEQSSLRRWLNGEFLANAFTEEERERIAWVCNQNPDNEYFDEVAEGGSPTWDRVFALSIDEALRYFEGHADRMAPVTPYAEAKGSHMNNNHKIRGRGTGWWWLRSPGIHSLLAAYVSSEGDVRKRGCFVLYSFGFVRPALWLYL